MRMKDNSKAQVNSSCEICAKVVNDQSCVCLIIQRTENKRKEGSYLFIEHLERSLHNRLSHGSYTDSEPYLGLSLQLLPVVRQVLVESSPPLNLPRTIKIVRKVVEVDPIPAFPDSEPSQAQTLLWTTGFEFQHHSAAFISDTPQSGRQFPILRIRLFLTMTQQIVSLCDF